MSRTLWGRDALRHRACGWNRADTGGEVPGRGLKNRPVPFGIIRVAAIEGTGKRAGRVKQ